MQKCTNETVKVCAVFYDKSIDMVMQVCYNIITARETNLETQKGRYEICTG